MTHTTQIEWHEDRPLIHFGSPPQATYWREESPKKLKSKKKRKKDKRG